MALNDNGDDLEEEFKVEDIQPYFKELKEFFDAVQGVTIE